MDFEVDLDDFMDGLRWVRFKVRHGPVFSVDFFLYRVHGAAEVLEFVDAAGRGACAERYEKFRIAPGFLLPVPRLRAGLMDPSMKAMS